MINIIHCADLHLDSSMETVLSPGQAAERRQELLANFIRMTQFARQNDVSLILIAGDLFDTDQVSPASASALCRAMQDNPDILFAYLQGNHDRGSFLSLIKEQPSNLLLFDGHWTSWRISPQIRLWGAELSAYAGHPEDREESTAFWDALRPDPACINLVMLHGTAVSSSEALLSREEIPLPLLTDRGIDYLALGHIHRHQSGSLDQRGDWCYAGCLEGRGFDECGPHGFELISADEEARTLSHRFVPFAGRIFYELPVDLTGCRSSMDALDLIRVRASEEGCRPQDIVHVILEGDLPPETDLFLSLLGRELDGAFYALRISDCTGIRVDYEAYEDDPSFRGTFVRLVREDPSLDPDLKAEIIRCGIQALSGRVDTLS